MTGPRNEDRAGVTRSPGTTHSVAAWGREAALGVASFGQGGRVAARQMEPGMNFGRIRAAIGRRISGTSGAAQLARTAGSVPSIEHLERRQMLAFPDTSTATALTLVSGVVNLADTIDSTSDEGWFSFQTTSSNFVTVLADAMTSAGSSLNTRVDLYVESTATPGFAVPAVGANGATLSATGNGTLTAGTPTDAWVGFVSPTSTTTYYIRVRGESSTIGNYTLRVDTLATGITPTDTGGEVITNGNLPRRGADHVYRIATTSNAAFDSLAFLNAEADAGTLDTRIEIFDAQGTLFRTDSNTGIDSNAAAWFKAAPSSVYYVRVRSDEFASGRPASGNYSLHSQFSSTNIALDPLTRQGNTGGALSSQGHVYSFTAVASGRAVIQALGVGFTPVEDPAIRLFNSSGTQLAFNDNSAGVNSEIQLNLTGGERYFILFDGFSSTPPVAGTTYAILVAANATVDAVDGTDDHADRGDFLNASPLQWGTPYQNVTTIEHKIAAVGSGRIATAGDTDVFVFVPPRDMLGQYPGQVDFVDSTIWMEDEAEGISLRPNTRVQIAVSPGPGFLNTSMEVWRFDPSAGVEGVGAFVMVYSNTNATIPDQGISGMYDPAQADPGAIAQLSGLLGQNVNGISVWAGQPYYIVVNGTGVGEFSVVVEVDALNTDGGVFYQDFDLAPSDDFEGPVNITPSGATGDNRMYSPVLNAFPIVIAANLSVYGWGLNDSRFFVDGTAENGYWFDEYRQTRLPSLSDFNDADMYSFTAPYSGTFEIRINTTSLANAHHQNILNYFNAEVFPDPADPPEVVVDEAFNEFYNSILDSALRIFNNDREQIAYNDDNLALSGDVDRTIENFGVIQPLAGDVENPFTRFTFHRRDARVVFNVVEGETYYIQVENGQRYKNGAPANAGDRVLAANSEIDWTQVAGSYELLINGSGNPQNLPGAYSSLQDDHPDFLGQLADGTPRPTVNTVIPMDHVTGSGSIGGVINTTGDADLFIFRATKTGLATLTVARTSEVGNLVVPRVEVNTIDGQLLAAGRATSTGVITITFPVVNGQAYDVQVFQDSINTGAYTLTVSDLAYPDDFADKGDFGNAHAFPLQDFLGGGSVSGSIEEIGDSDLFSFEAFTSQTFTINLTATSTTLNPVLEVYEVAEDPVGNPFIRRIGLNDNISGSNLNSRLVIGVNSPRTSGASGNTYNTYYILVRGANGNLDAGNYNLDISFPPSDDHADVDEFPLASAIDPDSATGQAEASGIIELDGDSDLFYFVSPASGTSTVNVSVGGSSSLLQRVRIFDDTFTLVASNQDLNPTDVTFDTLRGKSYYILVDASPSAGSSEATGAYSIALVAPAIDDHPNIGEFDRATLITLAASTGDGGIGGTSFGDPANPLISPANDTDLFTFFSVASGTIVLTVTPYSDTAVGIGPRVRVFDASGTLIGGLDSSASTGLQTVTLNIPATAAGQQFYVLVSAITPVDINTVATGQYALSLNGPPGVAPPPPDPSVVDFENPIEVTLDGRADATINSSISVANERDLYRFVAPAKGDIYVQLLTPLGSRLSLSLTVLNAANELVSSQIAFDAGGLPGVASSVVVPRSLVSEGQEFWIIVDGIGTGTGAYTLKIDASPEMYALYYPEGFSNNRIREVVSISNGGTVDANYTVILRYNDGLETVVRSGTIGAGRRGGVTISNGSLGAAGVRRGVPYSIVIESDAPLGATLAHYDFEQSTGDSFTDAPSGTWTFARVERNPGNVADALTVYNPNPFDVTLTLTAHTSTGTVVLTKVVGANRRGGWNIGATSALPVGVFGVTLTSRATSSANDAAFIGVVAGLAHYDVARGGAYGVLGQTGQGSTVGAIPTLTNGSGVSSEVALYNPGDLPTTVVITGQYVNASLPTLSRSIDIPARSTLVFSAEALGLIADQAIGLVYRSTYAIVVLAAEYQKGEANAAPAFTEVGTRYFFGDAFINKTSAGVNYFETLSFYNPASRSNTITVRLLFTTGEVSTFTVPINAQGFAQVNLHERPEILDRTTNLNYFSIDLSAPTQFGVQFTHYDLFLGGGYSQSGAPLGLLTPLSRIS